MASTPFNANTMVRPNAYLIRMGAFVVAAMLLALALREPLSRPFMANPYLNSMIITLWFAGIAYAFRQVLQLWPDIDWLEQFATRQQVLSTQRRNFKLTAEAPKITAQPRLLAPLARLLQDQGDRPNISALALRSLMDGVGGRIDESRELSRYLIGLLIFMGLLGTFWGLLQTVSSVHGVIASLSFDTNADMGTMFTSMKNGLEAPLSGMGSAFSASLFGLAGSLTLGFLELQAGQAQSRFLQ